MHDELENSRVNSENENENDVNNKVELCYCRHNTNNNRHDAYLIFFLSFFQDEKQLGEGFLL